jgi:hypothetical protein
MTTEIDDEVRALPGKRFRVTLGDDESFTVRVTNRDFIAWDRTAPRKKWGTQAEVPFLFVAFCTWSASRREKFTSLNFDAPDGNCWCDVVEDITPLEDGAEDDAARPTRTAAAPA